MTKHTYLWTVAGLVLGSAFVAGSVATAAPTGRQDAVLGVATTDDGTDTFAIDAFSDPSGRRPGGTVYGQQGDLSAGGVYTLERVVCFAVEGARATVGTQILTTNIAGTPAGTYQVYSFVDNAAAGKPDLIGGGWLGATAPTCEIDHSDPPAGYAPIVSGDITITDN